MGRHRNLYSVTKKEFQNFDFFFNKNLNKDERYDELYESFEKVFKKEFEIGKFLNLSSALTIKSNLEADIHIITEELLKGFIKEYYEQILIYYKEIFNEKDEKMQFFEMLQHFRTKIFDLENWESSVCLDKNVDRLTNNWKYETDVLDIIRIYKTFDFENKMLICVYS